MRSPPLAAAIAAPILVKSPRPGIGSTTKVGGSMRLLLVPSFCLLGADILAADGIAPSLSALVLRLEGREAFFLGAGRVAPKIEPRSRDRKSTRLNSSHGYI